MFWNGCVLLQPMFFVYVGSSPLMKLAAKPWEYLCLKCLIQNDSIVLLCPIFDSLFFLNLMHELFGLAFDLRAFKKWAFFFLLSFKFNRNQICYRLPVTMQFIVRVLMYTIYNFGWNGFTLHLKGIANARDWQLLCAI